MTSAFLLPMHICLPVICYYINIYYREEESYLVRVGNDTKRLKNVWCVLSVIAVSIHWESSLHTNV